MNDELRPRIVGTETEQALEIDHVFVKDHVKRFKSHNVKSANEYLSNGARMYPDIANLLEYATPECASFADLVHAEFAGERIVRSYLDCLIEEDEETPKKYHHHKRCSSDGVTSVGYHENYQVTREAFRNGDLRPLHIAQLISRTIFTGGGLLKFGNKDESYPYITPAQKLHTIEDDISSNTTEIKPIFNTRDKPYADKNFWARLHTVSGDPTLLPWSTWMKFGATSIVLRLLESGLYDLRDIHIADPIRAAHAISSHAEALVELDTGKKARAIDIQESFVEQAVWLSELIELPHEEMEILVEWQKAIEQYHIDPDLLSGKVDWITRSRLIRNFTENRGGVYDRDEVRLLDQLWDNLKPGVGLAISRCRNSRHAPFYDETEVRRLEEQPPLNTRARLRGEAVQEMSEPERLSPDIDISWVNVRTPRVSLNLIDPYRCN